MSWHHYDELHREDLLRRLGYPAPRKPTSCKARVLLIFTVVLSAVLYLARHRIIH